MRLQLPIRGSHWLLSPDPMHRLAATIDERINPKIPSKRGPPTHPLGARRFVLANEHKYSGESPMLSPWCQQAEVTNGVSVSIRNVLGQDGDELLERVPFCHFPAMFLVLCPELDGSILDT